MSHVRDSEQEIETKIMRQEEDEKSEDQALTWRVVFFWCDSLLDLVSVYFKVHNILHIQFHHSLDLLHLNSCPSLCVCVCVCVTK